MPTSPTLRLPRPIATALLAQAQSAPQQRVCGLLLARNGEAVALAPLRNHAIAPARAHQFDAAEFAAACDAARATGQQPMAVYHSHPDSPPVASVADMAANPAPALPVLVISLDTKGVLEMRAFAGHDDNVTEIPLSIFL